MKNASYVHMLENIFKYALKKNCLEPVVQSMICDNSYLLKKQYQYLIWRQNFLVENREMEGLSRPRFINFELMGLEKSFVAINWVGEFDFLRKWKIDDTQWGEEINWEHKLYSAIINSDNMRVLGCIQSDFYVSPGSIESLSRKNKDAPAVKYDSGKISIVQNGKEFTAFQIPQNNKTR